MALTRSKKIVDVSVKEINGTKRTVSQKTITKTSVSATTASSKKKTLKRTISTPTNVNYTLKESFKTLHHPGFVEGVQHVLNKDPTLWEIVDSGKFPNFEISQDPKAFHNLVASYISDKPGNLESVLQYLFESLTRGLIAQQISGAAATSIRAKICKAYDSDGKKFPPPKFFIDSPVEKLRELGLSYKKVEYIKGISEDFHKNHNIEYADFFLFGNSEKIIEKLTQFKGIGIWSAQMFLLFGTKKLDIFAPGDLGIARAVSRYLSQRPKLYPEIDRKGIIEKKKKRTDWIRYKPEDMELIAEDFKPHRSALMLILWQLGSTNVDVLTK